MLNEHLLATEIMKEAKMKNRLEADLMKMFDSYLFIQEIKEKQKLYDFLETMISKLMKAGLLDKNVDGEIITPKVVDIILDHGIDDLDRMLCLLNLSKALIGNKLDIFSGHIFCDITYELCTSYGFSGIAPIKSKYDSERVKRYITEKVHIEPVKIDNGQRLFVALDLYITGTSLEKIEEAFGMEPDAVPYVADNIASRDFVLLKELVKSQCLGDPDKIRLCDYLEMCAGIIKKGVPYQVLPFMELIDRMSRKAALSILDEYKSGTEILRILADEKKTNQEFIKLQGIAKILGQRIIDKRKELISNLQKKIKLWGTFTF